MLLSYGRTIYQLFNHDDKSILRQPKPYEIRRQGSNDFQEEDDRTGVATYTANNYCTKSAGMNRLEYSENDDKCTESNDGKHTYR
jgi:hypothetical protein